MKGVSNVIFVQSSAVNTTLPLNTLSDAVTPIQSVLLPNALLSVCTR